MQRALIMLKIHSVFPAESCWSTHSHFAIISRLSPFPCWEHQHHQHAHFPSCRRHVSTMLPFLHTSKSTQILKLILICCKTWYCNRYSITRQATTSNQIKYTKHFPMPPVPSVLYTHTAQVPSLSRSHWFVKYAHFLVEKRSHCHNDKNKYLLSINSNIAIKGVIGALIGVECVVFCEPKMRWRANGTLATGMKKRGKN